MSDTPTASPVVLGRWEKPGNLASIAALAASGQVAILPHELIRTTDGRVYHWTGTALEITSAPVHHGTVADVAALDGIHLLPSCTRGVHPGDTAYVTAAGCEYRVASGVNATATWSACASIPSIPTTPSEVGADPAGTAATAVSAHNTAPDAHADIRTLVAGKQDSLTISTVGTALLNLSTPTAVKIPRINADASVTLIDFPDNVEEVDADFVSISYNPSGGGASRGLYSGLMSSAAPTQANTGLGTWYNQGSCTLSEHAGGLTILNPTLGGSNNTGGLYRAAPAAPWVLTTLVSISCKSGDYPAARLGFIDTTTGRTSIFGFCANGTLSVANFSAPNSQANNMASVSVAGTRVLWLRLSDDGSSLHFSYSWDGVNFVELYSVSRSSSYAGYTHIFFGASSHSITASATLLSWSIS